MAIVKAGDNRIIKTRQLESFQNLEGNSPVRGEIGEFFAKCCQIDVYSSRPC